MPQNAPRNAASNKVGASTADRESTADPSAFRGTWPTHMASASQKSWMKSYHADVMIQWYSMPPLQSSEEIARPWSGASPAIVSWPWLRRAHPRTWLHKWSETKWNTSTKIIQNSEEYLLKVSISMVSMNKKRKQSVKYVKVMNVDKRSDIHWTWKWSGTIRPGTFLISYDDDRFSQ